MQIIRNRWAHSDMSGLDEDAVYRDFDNLQQFFALIDASEEIVAEVKQFKNDILSCDIPIKENIESETQSLVKEEPKDRWNSLI